MHSNGLAGWLAGWHVCVSVGACVPEACIINMAVQLLCSFVMYSRLPPTRGALEREWVAELEQKLQQLAAERGVLGSLTANMDHTLACRVRVQCAAADRVRRGQEGVTRDRQVRERHKREKRSSIPTTPTTRTRTR